jgi:hypothetical protein
LLYDIYIFNISFSGNKDGQTKMVKTSEGKVELHHWEASTSQWKKIGDVVGSSGGITKLFGLVISDENILKVSGNNTEELLMATMFLQGQD